jgi:hypothetical protein
VGTFTLARIMRTSVRMSATMARCSTARAQASRAHSTRSMLSATGTRTAKRRTLDQDPRADRDRYAISRSRSSEHGGRDSRVAGAWLGYGRRRSPLPIRMR